MGHGWKFTPMHLEEVCGYRGKQTPDYDFTLDSIPPFLLRGHAHLATSGNRTVLGHVI